MRQFGEMACKATEMVPDLKRAIRHFGALRTIAVMVEKEHSGKDEAFVKRIWAEKHFICTYRWVHVLTAIMTWSEVLQEIVLVGTQQFSPEEANKQIKKGLL